MDINAYQNTKYNFNYHGNEESVLTILSLHDEDNISQLVSSDIPIHHIQLIDKSGSMHYDLPKLIDDVKVIIEKMKRSDFFTVILFSSVNDYDVIFKNVSRDITDDTLKQYFDILDHHKVASGCTCFSSPMKETESIINNESILADVSVTLFTDGEPVCPWSESEEDNKVTDIIKSVSDKIISFNTVGYGNYYNRELLQKWALLSEFGIFTHSSNIDDYLEIYDHNYELIASEVSNTPSKRIKIESDGVFDAFVVSNRNSKLVSSKGTTAEFSMHMTKNTNQIVIVSITDNISIFVNGKNQEIPKYRKVPENWNDVILYKMAYGYFTYKDTPTAMRIYATILKDKKIADLYANSFTNKEISQLNAYLRNALYKKAYRSPNTVKDVIYNKNAPCVLSLLTELANANYVLYKYQDTNYQRITRKVIDNFNMFTPNEGEPALVDNIVFNEKYLNVSLRFLIQGHVSINPNSASRVNLPKDVEAKIYRNHTIIKDGNLNVSSITIVIEESFFSKLRYKGYKDCLEVESAEGSYYTVKVLFDKLPLINYSYSNYSLIDIAKMVEDINKCKSIIKLTDYAIQNTNTIFDGSGQSRKYSPEQINLLEEYGIKDGIYSCIDPETASKSEDDFYICRSLEFYMKGFSTIPSVNKYLKDRDSNKIASNEVYLNEYYDDICSGKSYKELLAGKSNANDVLRIAKSKLCGYKIAKILSSTPLDTPKSIKEYYNGYDSQYESGLIVKYRKEKVYY